MVMAAMAADGVMTINGVGGDTGVVATAWRGQSGGCGGPAAAGLQQSGAAGESAHHPCQHYTAGEYCNDSSMSHAGWVPNQCPRAFTYCDTGGAVLQTGRTCTGTLESPIIHALTQLLCIINCGKLPSLYNSAWTLLPPLLFPQTNFVPLQNPACEENTVPQALQAIYNKRGLAGMWHGTRCAAHSMRVCMPVYLTLSLTQEYYLYAHHRA